MCRASGEREPLVEDGDGRGNASRPLPARPPTYLLPGPAGTRPMRGAPRRASGRIGPRVRRGGLGCLWGLTPPLAIAGGNRGSGTGVP